MKMLIKSFTMAWLFMLVYVFTAMSKESILLLLALAVITFVTVNCFKRLPKDDHETTAYAQGRLWKLVFPSNTAPEGVYYSSILYNHKEIQKVLKTSKAIGAQKYLGTLQRFVPVGDTRNFSDYHFCWEWIKCIMFSDAHVRSGGLNCNKCQGRLKDLVP